MKMTETGTNYSNVMFHYAFGANNAANTFTGTYSIYIPSVTPYQVFGMDMYQYIPGVRLMFGSQCALAGATAGFWSFFDQGSGPNGTWHVTTVPCPLTSGAWYTISMTVHRVPGDTSCAGGLPAEHYDSLTQNGTTYILNLSYCSEVTAFSNDTGMQFDVSSNAAGGTLTAYVDQQTYTASIATNPTNGPANGPFRINSTPDTPLYSGNPQYTNFNTYTLPSPFLTSAGILGGVGCTANVCTSQVYFDKGTTCPSFDFTQLDTQLGVNIIPAGKKFNLILGPANEGGNAVVNTQSPVYWFTQAWADLLNVDCAGSTYEGLRWVAATTYRPGDYVCVDGGGSCNSGTGTYWQQTGVTTGIGGDIYSNGCTSSNSQPAFVDSGGPYTETGSFPCTWTETINHGAHAPPQDSFYSNAYQGSAYVLQLGTTGTGDVNVTTAGKATINFPASQQPVVWVAGTTRVTVSGVLVGGVGNSSFDCTNCLVTSLTSSRIQYTKAGTQNSVTFSAGTASANSPFLLNIQSPNATTTVVEDGLPVSYELPMKVGFEADMQAVMKHYSANCDATTPPCSGNGGFNGPALAPSLQYVRFGLSQGGENSAFTGNPAIWPFYSTATYQSWVHDALAVQRAAQVANSSTALILADLHMNSTSGAPDPAYSNSTAGYAIADCMGFGTNAMNVANVVEILSGCPNASTPGSCASDDTSIGGNFYKNFQLYKNTLNSCGTLPILSLQPIGPDNPGDCTGAGSFPTGSLGPISAATATSQGCNALFQSGNGYLGLLAYAKQFGANNFESYSNNPNYPSQGSNTPVGMIVGTDSLLSNQIGYSAALAAFLGLGYTLGGNAVSGSFTIGGMATVVTSIVSLPLNWVNNKEYQGTTTNTVNFPSAWTCSGSSSFGPYTGGNQASLNQAIADAEHCRTTTGNGTTINIPPVLYSGLTGLILPQTAGDTSPNFIVLNSTAPLASGRTACSHGSAAQDNISESTQPALRNLGCNGSALSYQLGTTVTTVPAGAFTFANGINANTFAYNDVASMWTDECTQAACNGISTAPADVNGVGPHHFAILNAEIRPLAGLSAPNAPVKIGQGTETTLAQMPQHIHIAYSYLHGDWGDAPVTGGVATGPPTGANALPNDLVWAGCFQCSVAYSYFDKSLRPGSEGHSVLVTLGQQLKLVHNWFEGNSSGTFCGGYTSTLAFTGFLACTDVEDRANRYTYPYSWMLAAQAGFKPNGGANGFARKNAHESKVAQRYLFDGNIVENVDGTGGQAGTAMSVKTDNATNAGSGNFWLTDTDYTLTNNILRNTCTGPSWGFRSQSTAGNGGGVSLPTQRALYANNLMYNISVLNPGCTGVSPQTGFRIANNFNNAWNATATRDAAGTTTTLTLSGGDAQSDMNIGDPVSVTSCVDTSFNTSTTAMGPAALVGTSPSSLTVVYANPGAASATTTGCKFNNLQGWPNYLTFSHNTDVIAPSTFPGDPDSSANGGATPYVLSRNLSFTNSIFINGGIYSTFAEGTRTQTKAFDPATEAFNNVLMPGRSVASCPGGSGPSCYTEYSAANPFPGISPPVTVYLTPTAFCTGNDPTVGNCSGIFGAMSTGVFPLTLNDWNQFRLCHAGDVGCNSNASRYAAGQSGQASDNSDLGVSMSSISAAEISTFYTCNTYCGTGPFPDN